MTHILRPTLRLAGVILITATFLTASLTPAAFAQQIDPSSFSGLHWRMIGPFRGGRVNGVTGVPGHPNTFYFGSVGGGVWKSINSGRTWTPVFDGQQIASIGAVAVAPSAPNTVYVGTGEADTELRPIRARGPDLLSRELPATLCANGFHPKRRQV